MIIEVITLASGFAAGIVFDRNIKISASLESQRIAQRLLRTGLAQLPSADSVKSWAVGAIASARSQAPALPAVREISDNVLKKIEFEARGVRFDELQKGLPPLPPLPLSEEELKELEPKSAFTRADEMDATRDQRVAEALDKAWTQKTERELEAASSSDILKAIETQPQRLEAVKTARAAQVETSVLDRK